MTSAGRTPERDFPERALHLDWFDWLTRHRTTIYALLGLFYLACFNGFWRVGVDSALYRGLGRSLARGEGYVFAGELHHHAYPGLPWILAVFDRLFGETPVPGLILMTIMSIATLWLVDRLIALRYPLWVAMVVTIGMAVNVRLVRQSQQLMTDVPFTLGVVASLYALERLRLIAKKAKWTEFATWSAFMVAALGLAAATRPTFGVLAGAIVVGSAFRAVRGDDRRRWMHAGILVAAVLVMLALFLVDPRTVGIRPMQGVYEQELVERVQDLPKLWADRVHALLARDLNDAFFAQRISPASYVASLLVLFSSALVFRRDIVWGLMIFGLVAITLPLSSVPRYYLMVMPFMLLGWILMWCWITLRIPAKFQGPVLALALGFPMMVNGGRSVGFLQEQRAPDFAKLFHGKDRETYFYANYRNGIVPKQQAIAKMIADHATKKQIVIGPDAHTLAYFADRRVIGERTLFIDRDAALSKWPQIVAKAGAAMAVFPVNLYTESDSMMRDLIRRRILFASTEIAHIQGAQLAVAGIRLPPAGTDWRKYRGPASTMATTHRTTATTQKLSPTKKAEILAKRKILADRALKAHRADKQAKLDRQARLDRRAKASTQPTTDKAAKRKHPPKRARADSLLQGPSSQPANDLPAEQHKDR